MLIVDMANQRFLTFRFFAVVATIFLLFGLIGCSTKPSPTDRSGPLFRYFENSKVGFIDVKGKIIISARYDMAGLFKDGMAPASRDGAWGYIDRTGDFITPPQWKDAGHFNDGVACVQLREENISKIEQIDGKDTRVISSRLIYSLIDIRGNPINGVEFEPCFHGSTNWVPPAPHAGKICVKDAAGDYYLGLTGQRVLGTFWRANPFRDGVAVVNTGTITSVIDTEGRFVIASVNPNWMLRQFSEGLAVATQYGQGGFLTENSGYVDKSGNIAIPFDFKMAFPFHEGVAIVKDKIGQFRLINQTGATVAVPPDEMSFIGPFVTEEMAIIFKPCFTGNCYGYMDVKTGVVVIPPVLEEAFPFRDGLAWVSMAQPRQSGYIDKKGDFVWRAKSPGKLETQINGKYFRLLNEMSEVF
jgi:hypothetical protein